MSHNAIADYHWDEGKQAGIKIGREEGKAEGKAEATRDLVARQLQRKFGPLSAEHQAKLDSATLEQLELYSDTLLTSSSVDEVFTSAGAS
ncbi:MAG: DUF4351 domain-containing protein [Burkholderiaceae bacterium]